MPQLIKKTYHAGTIWFCRFACAIIAQAHTSLMTRLLNVWRRGKVWEEWQKSHATFSFLLLYDVFPLWTPIFNRLFIFKQSVNCVTYCISENGEYLKSIADKILHQILFDEITNATDSVSTNVSTNFHSQKYIKWLAIFCTQFY